MHKDGLVVYLMQAAGFGAVVDLPGALEVIPRERSPGPARTSVSIENKLRQHPFRVFLTENIFEGLRTIFQGETFHVGSSRPRNIIGHSVNPH
jgi:hypothetical protein